MGEFHLRALGVPAGLHFVFLVELLKVALVGLLLPLPLEDPFEVRAKPVYPSIDWSLLSSFLHPLAHCIIHYIPLSNTN